MVSYTTHNPKEKASEATNELLRKNDCLFKNTGTLYIKTFKVHQNAHSCGLVALSIVIIKNICSLQS